MSSMLICLREQKYYRMLIIFAAVCIWAEHDIEITETEGRTFLAIGTGEPFSGKNMEFIDTVLIEGTVRHIYDDTAEGKKARRWGVTGVIVGHHNSHGLCYDVRHDDERKQIF